MRKLIILALGSSVGFVQALPEAGTYIELTKEQVVDIGLINILHTTAAHELSKNDSVSDTLLSSIPENSLKIQWQQTTSEDVSWVLCLTAPVEGLIANKVVSCGVNEYRYLYTFSPEMLSGERHYHFNRRAVDGSCSYLKAGGISHQFSSRVGLSTIQETTGSWIQLLVANTELKLSSDGTKGVNGIYSLGGGNILGRCCGCFGSSTQDEDSGVGGGSQQQSAQGGKKKRKDHTSSGGDQDPPKQPTGGKDAPKAALAVDQGIVDALKQLIQSAGGFANLAQSLGTAMGAPMEGTVSVGIPINATLIAWTQVHNVEIGSGALTDQWLNLFNGLMAHQGDINAFASAAQATRQFKSMLINSLPTDS